MRHRAQSTVEHLLLVTAVIAISFIVLVKHGSNSSFQVRLNEADSTTIDAMQTKATQLHDSIIY